EANCPAWRQSAVATSILVSALFPVTRDWFCSRTRRFHRRIGSKAGKALSHPIGDDQARSSPDFSPPTETNAPPVASACCASRATGVRSAFEGERKRRQPGLVP